MEPLQTFPLDGNATATHKARVYSVTDFMQGRLVSWLPDATLADMARGEGLARALGGRWVRGFAGWRMLPRYARCWVKLFDAGFSAKWREYVPGSVGFYAPAERGALTLKEAMRKAKDLQEK